MSRRLLLGHGAHSPAEVLILDVDPVADVKTVRGITAVYKAGMRAGPRGV